MNFHEIQLTKAKVYLTSDEINALLMKDKELYQKALGRGKAFNRGERFENPTPTHNPRDGQI